MVQVTWVVEILEMRLVDGVEMMLLKVQELKQRGLRIFLISGKK